MARHLPITLIAIILSAGACVAERSQLVGTVTDARSGIPVSVHPVTVTQDGKTVGRVLTDRLGKFKIEFAYTAGKPLVIKSGSTSAYLEAQGVVEPDTEVLVKVMPRWATILGIVTDRRSGRGLADIPVRVGRGEKLLNDSWASVKTDATGVYMLRVPAFPGDDVTEPIRDLWLSVNEEGEVSEPHAMVRTDTLPLWAWTDRTQPTKVEITLPPADAQGLTIADVVSIKAPDALKPVEPPAPAETPPSQPEAVPGPELEAGECIVTCPHCNKRFKVILVPVD